MKVRNMGISNGNKVANQVILIDGEGNRYFQSYETVIAKVVGRKVFLDKEAWDTLLDSVILENKEGDIFSIGYLGESGDLWAIPEGYEIEDI